MITVRDNVRTIRELWPTWAARNLTDELVDWLCHRRTGPRFSDFDQDHLARAIDGHRLKRSSVPDFDAIRDACRELERASTFAPSGSAHDIERVRLMRLAILLDVQRDRPEQFAEAKAFAFVTVPSSLEHDRRGDDPERWPVDMLNVAVRYLEATGVVEYVTEACT